MALLRVPRRATAFAAQLALVLAVAVLVGLGLLPRTGWYRPVTVLSGSMRPAFAPGDMVVVTPEPVSTVRVGQVISYRIPVGDHHVQSHRVIAVLRRDGRVSVRTKGDANATGDAPRDDGLAGARRAAEARLDRLLASHAARPPAHPLPRPTPARAAGRAADLAPPG